MGDNLEEPMQEKKETGGPAIPVTTEGGEGHQCGEPLSAAWPSHWRTDCTREEFLNTAAWLQGDSSYSYACAAVYREEALELQGAWPAPWKLEMACKVQQVAARSAFLARSAWCA
jgi:hypothetical protein